MTLSAVIVGPGKMGRTIADLWRGRGHEIRYALGRDDDLDAARSASVAFEFTRPDAAADNVTDLLRMGVPTVCGTTGWDPEPVSRLADELAVPLLVAANFSIGIAVLKAAVDEVARRLAAFEEFEPGVFERHHRQKLDSPSGTARMLSRVIEESAGSLPPVAALRQGGQPGEHRVIFEGAEESLELVHRARSRRIFALGAVRAAEWLVASGERGSVSFQRFVEQAGADHA
ncbi:MAG: dihydrodipicolinate reductase C-terminal domain-containing protein [Thermoanaerobaculia bacterium]|nr:dihydrodipicolinate reductase C-terminal domain-containing protein [Thermoanaerobaculia bacterium]